MNLQEIKAAVDEGKKVYWASLLYEVRRHERTNGQYEYNIVCTSNGYTVGLTWRNGVTLNGKEEEFFTR